MGIRITFRLSTKKCITVLYFSILSHIGYNPPNMSTILGYDRTLDTSTTLMCISTYKLNACYPSWSTYILFYGLGYRNTIISLMLNTSFFLLLQSLICHGTNGYFYLKLLSLAVLGGLDLTIFSTAASSYPTNS